MIQWFPGHMHKASKEFKNILPQVDLIIEVLDARLPGSSENPMLTQLRKDKPSVKLLNKADLADPQVLQQWQDHLELQSGVKTLVCSQLDEVANRLPVLCRSMIPARENRSNMIYAMIAGIPNVGKSTLINQLAGRSIAKTGNEAALTRMQQRIEISSELTLIDTPGMLWGNIINEASGYRLAASGAIRDSALNIQDVGSFIAEFLIKKYPDALRRRYEIEQLPQNEIELLEIIARLRGCIISGGRVDLEKVSRLIIHELREGEFGPICFESPQEFTAELAQAEELAIEKIAKKAAKKAARKQSRRN
ncbi:MAG: ribosome biogenesis GTPase A [Gammaproteobacteria bacterium]|jgi:ribosome biogenesis GTPase A